MQTIEILSGTDIDRAAALLVTKAPAHADFNGITIRACYATTKPSDIAARFRRLCAERSYAYQCSPEGRRDAERNARDVADKQSCVDSLLRPEIMPDFASIGDVLSWVIAFAPLADRVRYDHAALVTYFEAGGWGPGVNCGADFNGDDARNFAGWIVGQWLASRYPGVERFVDQWRERFLTAAA